MALIEGIVVALIVAAACVYAAWVLMPYSLRSRAAITAGRWAASDKPLPHAVRRALQGFAERQQRRSPGCGSCKSTTRVHPPGDTRRSPIRRV